MTIKPVELSPEAFGEAQSAEQWYRERSERAALRFVDELEAVFDTLAEHPEIGPRWEHRGIDERVRRSPLARYPFVLFYVVGNETVRVLAVAHTSRRPGYWVERLINREHGPR